MWILIGSLSLLGLGALIIRFVQPEIIYGFQEALMTARLNHTLLRTREHDEDVSDDIRRSFATGVRIESVVLDEKELALRMQRSAELFPILKQLEGREGMDDIMPVAYCLIEQGALVSNLARRLPPCMHERPRPAVEAADVLCWVQTAQTKTRIGRQDRVRAMEGAMRAAPLSTRQIFELQAAVVQALGFKIFQDVEVPSTETNLSGSAIPKV